MSIYSTGPIENSPVGGVRPTQQVAIKIVNRNPVSTSTVLIQGYDLNGSRTLYVLELFTVAPNQVITKDYFANLDAYEFVLITESSEEYDTEISVWGKTASGYLVDAHRLVAQENYTESE